MKRGNAGTSSRGALHVWKQDIGVERGHMTTAEKALLSFFRRDCWQSRAASRFLHSVIKASRSIDSTMEAELAQLR
jgi:hypothetical protein